MDLLDEFAGDGVRQRRAPGRRQARLLRERRERRRRLRRRLLLAGGVVLVVAGLVAAGVLLWPDGTGGGSASEAPEDGPVAGVGEQETLLLVRTEGPGRPASGFTLLAVSPDRADVVFVPASTLVELPGFGLDRLALAQQYGGTTLSAAGLENLLGIEVDAVAAVDREGLATLLQEVGGFEVDVAQRLVARADDGTGEVAFEPGRQYLNGARLADYWAFTERGDTELDTFPRQQAVLTGLFAVLQDDGARAAFVDRADQVLDGDVDRDDLAAFVDGLAAASAAEAVRFHLLPVEPFGAGDDVLPATYHLRGQAAAELVDAVLAGSVPDGGGADAVPVQVLNGVGRPGIGREVDAALQGLGLRIVLSENARSFDFEQTQIVIYDESAATRQRAEQVREALGVGTILVSRQPQSVVAMTIVVGADFRPDEAADP